MKDYPRIARKITAVLFATQSLVSAGGIVIGTVSAIVGAQLSGNPAWAGVPSAVLQLGAAFAALGIGAAMDRVGRRLGMAAGLAAGVLGAGLSVGAILSGAFVVLLSGLVLIGFGRAAMQLGRFAAAEVHPPESRGRAISYVVIGGTVGSVAGPLITGPSGQLALRSNLDEMAGPFIVALIIFAIASVVIFLFLRPDPREIGQEIAELHPETSVQAGLTRSNRQIFRNPNVIVAVCAMVFSQMIMVMLMGITSLHMRDHNHVLTDISVVFSAHTLGMFAFSIVTGRLTDLWGRGSVILTGAVMLIIACALAPLSPDLVPLSIALFVLGLGWNLCYIGGSALLSDQLSPAERAKTQGANDLLIGFATAGGSLGSGLIFATGGYATLGIVGLLASLIPLGLTGWWMTRNRKLATI